MARLNGHHSSSATFSNLYGFIPNKLSLLTKVIEYRSILEIDDHKTKIRPIFMLWTAPAEGNPWCFIMWFSGGYDLH